MADYLKSTRRGTPKDSATPLELFGYRIVDRLGVGAGSTIYAAQDPQTLQVVALKHVVRTNEKSIRFVEQLEAEYEVSRGIQHPNLRRALVYKVSKTLLRKVTDAALIMEMVDGKPLETHLPRSVPEIVEVFVQTARGLHHLHGRGYVHCDLKPNNILRCSDRHVKVIDLGQTCRAGTVKPRIQGTPDYIAPEQVRCEPVTFKTDIYNFGATLYWCLCGKNFPTLFTLKKGENSFLVDSQIPTPMELNPRVPEPLSNLVMECVRTNASRRPADMVELGRRLETVQLSLISPVSRAVDPAASGLRSAVSPLSS